jgi:hypothetical protein
MHGFLAPAGMEPRLLREGRVCGRVVLQVFRPNSAPSFQSNTVLLHPHLRLTPISCWRSLISQATSFSDYENPVAFAWSGFRLPVNATAALRRVIQTAEPLQHSPTLCAALLELSRAGGAPVP